MEEKMCDLTRGDPVSEEIRQATAAFLVVTTNGRKSAEAIVARKSRNGDGAKGRTY